MPLNTSEIKIEDIFYFAPISQEHQAAFDAWKTADQAWTKAQQAQREAALQARLAWAAMWDLKKG